MIELKNFKLDLEDFIKKIVIIASENVDSVEDSDEYVPIFYDSGEYKKTQLVKKKDWGYFARQSIRKEITELREYRILMKYLNQKEFEHINLKIPNTLEDIPILMTRDYLSDAGEFTFKRKSFDKIFKKFLAFIENFSEDEYIIPLFNFDSDIKKSMVMNDFKIRRITKKEFTMITKIEENHKKMPKIFTKLTHVIEIQNTSTKEFLDYEIIQNKVKKIIESLSLIETGTPEFGTIYRNINKPWIQFDFDGYVEKLPKEMMIFKKNKKRKLENFYSILDRINFQLKEHMFLKVAKDRFVMALSREDTIDKLIDHMIIIEALYATEKTELTHRISTRVATLIGKNDSEMYELHKQMKNIYDVRSRIVHGEDLNKVKIKPDEAVQKLIEINRKSLEYFLNMTKHYNERLQSAILADLDRGIMDRDFLKEFRKNKLK